MSFDPDLYTITIRKEIVDGEVCYVGKVAEFQNVSAYEDTYDAALTTIRDVLTTIAIIADKKKQSLPAPMANEVETPSGRITLRMPRSLHAKVLRRAEYDEVSANQVINTAITEYITGVDVASKVADVMRQATEAQIDAMTTYVTQSDSLTFSMPEPNWWQYGGAVKSAHFAGSDRAILRSRKPS